MSESVSSLPSNNVRNSRIKSVWTATPEKPTAKGSARSRRARAAVGDGPAEMDAAIGTGRVFRRLKK